MAETMTPRTIIGIIVVLVIALAMLDVVLPAVAAAALSLTGAAQTMVNLIPLIYVISIVLVLVGFATGKLHR